MALSKNQLRNMRNGVERDFLRSFVIEYTKSEFATALEALDEEFESVAKATFDTSLGAKFSFDAKRLMIKQWLIIKGKDF